jgi:hypothetical protein
VEWGSRFSFFALKPVKLHWEGIPIREIKKFSLVSDDNAQEIIFNLTRISNDGFYIYESNTVMPPGKKTEYRLWAEKKMIISASPQDSRKLAFRNVNAQAAFTD